MAREKPARRPMTREEVFIASQCEPYVYVTYLPGSPDKRFASDIAHAARAEQPVITEKQALYLRQLVWRYRRQLPVLVTALVPQKPDEASA